MEKIVSFTKDWFQEYRPEATLLNQVLWTLWAVWVLLLLIAVYRVIKFRLSLGKEQKIWGDGSGHQKTSVVIVPIKGVTPRHTSDFFQSLLEQNYSKYRVIVTVETSDDPAAEWLSDQFGIDLSHPVWAPENPESGLQNLQLVVAGKCKGRGQKVHNQLAAFEELTGEDEIIVFVDADIVCPPDWLARLTAPINRGTHDPATTYRWLVPERNRLASLFASVINASVTTQGGNVRENMPWGGSMAISRQVFDDIDVPRLFEGSVNDDLRLGKAAKKAGYKVGYIRNLVRPTMIDFTWGKFIEFSRRQYLQVKVFAPILYCGANMILGIYILGFVSIVASIVMGNLWAWVPLIIATVLDQFRAMTRESIYRNLFGNDKETYKKISKTSGVEAFLTPVYMTVHGLIVMSTWFMNKMEWGGIRYQVEGVNKTRVLQRAPVENASVKSSSVGELALPAGAVFSGLAAVGTGAFAASRSDEIASEPTPVDTGGGEAFNGTVTVSDTQPIDVTAREVEPQVDAAELEPALVTHEEEVAEETESFTGEAESEAEEVTDEAEEVTDEAEEVTDEPEEVTDEAEEVTDEAEEVTDEAEEVTDEAEEVTDEAEEVTDEAEEVTDEAEEVTDEAEEVTDEAEEVTDEVEADAGEIEVGVEEVEEITDEVEVLEVVSDTGAETEESVSSDEPVFTFQKLEPVEDGAEVAASDEVQEDEGADSEAASTFGEWVDEESDEAVAEEHASSDASGWVDESAASETDEAVDPQTEETSVPSVPVAVVKQAAPAVVMTGLGAELPAASRFVKTRKTRLTGNKKAGKKRIYLSHWKGQSRSIVRRRGNRVS